MTLKICITGKIIGTGEAYTKRNKQGDKLVISLYEMILTDGSKSYSLPVSRDSQSENPPCPSNKPNMPYTGKIRTDGSLGFRIEMFERGISNYKNSLVGTGDVVRTEIQIHKGPGYSEGCFLLTGDEFGRDKFQKMVEKFDTKNIDIIVK